MLRHYLAGLGVLVLASAPGLWAAEVPAAMDAAALAQRIDQHVAAGLSQQKIQPAPLADDAEFLRRVYLDLAGRIPRVQEVRDFLDDPDPDKRVKVVDRLLEGPHYVNHMAAVWRAQMLPVANNQQLQFLTPQFEVWLRRHLQENTPYDAMVRELLTVPVGFGGGRGAAVVRQPAGQPTPLAYYQANQFRPEELAASVSRMFLGIKLECAQCHNHPFNSWTRKQFWELAAFFAGISPQNPQQPFAPAPEKMDVRELKIPGTETTVQARFLDGTEPVWKTDTPVRGTLAEWLTRPDNPYFARAAANRLWAHFFGLGLIEPVDEPGDDNPPSHPGLLDDLANQLARHQFDLKYLIRAITQSRTYQATSTMTHESQSEPRAFARMPLKGLTAEQLFDSLAVATGYREAPNPQQRFFGVNTPRGDFLQKFTSQDKRTEQQTSILQALALMNGRFIADATSLERSEVLAAVVDSPFLDTAGRIEALYLAALSRKPRPDEMQKLVAYVDSGGAKNDPRTALADIFWALLNSSEFILNH